ncbi:unnamed protein product [Merluccius merluccius]
METLIGSVGLWRQCPTAGDEATISLPGLSEKPLVVIKRQTNRRDRDSHRTQEEDEEGVHAVCVRIIAGVKRLAAAAPLQLGQPVSSHRLTGPRSAKPRAPYAI